MHGLSFLKNAIRTGQLIGKFLLQKTSPEEENQIDAWRRKSKEHNRLIQDIGSEQLLQERIVFYQNIDPQKEWEKLNLSVSSNKKPGVYLKLTIAASILLLFSIGIYWLFTLKSQPHQTLHLAEILPGNYKAILYTSQGQRIQIRPDSNLIVEADSTIQVICNQIIYKPQPNPAISKDSLNTLEVPRGGEFKILLADGSEIWINSGSTLRYPTTFKGGHRTIELKGEAYFNVAPDNDRPFIVKTDKSIIQVYGTAFNVCAYPEDLFQYTTLEHGSIGLQTASQEIRLIPGEQVLVNAQGQLTIKQVDASKYGSWRNGLFIFEKEELESLMQKLARWYDVEVFFRDDKARHLHFTGDLNRYDQVQQVLEMLQLTTSISFSIQGRTILVESK